MLKRIIYQYLADEFAEDGRSAQSPAPSNRGLPEEPASEAPAPGPAAGPLPPQESSFPPAPAPDPLKNLSSFNSTPTKEAPMPNLGIPAQPELLALYEECRQNLRYPLAESAKNLVFGYGTGRSGLMVIGEAPGADEDEQGLPFVGRSGSYMMEVFERLGVKREDLYIANILKHRPPNNRPPAPEEIKLCTPYLLKQIAIIKPKLLLTAGNFASKFILQTETGVTKLRGQLHESPYGKVFPILHPSAIIRGAYPREMFEADIALALEIAKTL